MMNYSIVLSLLFFLLIGCKDSALNSGQIVNDKDELQAALDAAEPGDNIVLSNGVWEDVQIKMTKSGTEKKPITLQAETPGAVIIQGQSDIQLGADYLVVEGLYFTKGYTPSSSVISFHIEDTVANHSIVRNCAIVDYNQLQRNKADRWVQFRGRHNQLSHCYLSGKTNRGPTVRVDISGNESINNYHKIINNHFGPRPPKGGPSAETIQLGNSYTSVSPSYTLVANNLFDECNGEVEVISSKTNFNEFRNNVFYKSEGSLVTRHGNYCIVDGNYFIGDENSRQIGGVRLIGTGHTVTNNYFYNLHGSAFRSPLAVMNGIPKSPLNRYIQVTDVTVAHNSWINCTSPLQFGIGSNVSEADVLPASEIRSARPIRTVVANNLIYNQHADATPVVAHDELDGIQFESNVINNQGSEFDNNEGFVTASFDLKDLSNHIYTSASNFEDVELFDGFGFDQFNTDLFGNSRDKGNAVGAIVGSTSAPDILDYSKYGTDWFIEEGIGDGETRFATNGSQLIAAIVKSADGDTINLEAGTYRVGPSLNIKKSITIQSNEGVTLNFIGDSGNPLFRMHPGGHLKLKGLKLQGDGSQHAFAPLEENMSALYNLTVEDCVVENFDYILKAYKYSMAEDISLINSTFNDCNNGLELSEEVEDRGEYNAENISIDGCTFDGVQQNVIDYYRGGYDESTVGGNLIVKDSKFTRCGGQEQNRTLINTYGIINVELTGNTFTNNNVQLVAQLWGAKNNNHSDNTISNSGRILVEENLKLKTFY